MSRAAVSKSRADKGAKPGPPAHTPVVAHEIVPGKFNDQDWTFMVEKDGSEEFVEDIIDELVDNTLDVIYDNYVGQQLLPFTVTMAKDAILQIIEWQFLSRDEGEQDVETDQGWMEDEEPDPAVTDCWAQGSVPKALVPEKPMTPVEETIEENVEEEAAAEEVEEAQVEEEEPPELADKVSDTEEGPNQEEVQKTKEEEKKKKRTKYKPYTGRVKAGKGLNQMTESLEQTEMAMMYEEYVKSQEYEAAEKASGLLNMPVSCHSILKVQAGRPPGNKDVMYDDMGNVLAVIKLNPEKLPSHRVKVKYQVVDPAVEAAQARLEAMRHGRYMSRAIQRRLKRNKVEEIRPDEDLENGFQKDMKTPLPPPLTETMEISPGVTVREGGRVRRGPARYVRKVDKFTESQQSLRPVATRTTAPSLEVADLLDRQTPILRVMRDSPPLPPIVPHPPAQSRIPT
ncbi:uncharacterized protein C2orf81 homolog [Ylistrum balloti]|uniref:uncharacterized protein C2orf81 homolog n=1 Tax=Ylistrum balloti TaxID=509963 RepID=UPI002905A4C6|nr:uncharacterized protein C2orf81 homolog [Ylistrum balloti]